MLPACHAVLGVDVGFSLRRQSSAVCRLDWNEHTIRWTIELFRADEQARLESLSRVAGRSLLAAAFDGPLKPGFEPIGAYRAAEKMLTRRLQPHIGKPGASNAPVGRALNEATNACALIVKRTGNVAPASHAQAIDPAAIVESFPSSFLGLLIAEPVKIPAKRANRSDTFYQHLSTTGGLEAFVRRLLPDRKLAQGFDTVKNHDGRAALVCALAALCVAANDYVAVGDDREGWIILPPSDLIQPWGMQLLVENAKDIPSRLAVSG